MYMYYVILKYLWKLKLGPDIRLDIRPDNRFTPTNQQNYMKFVLSSQNVTIKKKYKYGNDSVILGSLIRPDIQPDIRFGHTNDQIRMKFGGDMYKAILK